MSHSSIAKVFDCGTTARGQPYFVMELVDGLPLTRYCDEHRLSLSERIALFQQVCGAVQHAHQKGLIHRDLKPSNILVVREGDRAVPKILDFGLAKATNRELLARTVFTERDHILGTPEYMAPEQASFEHDSIDTRADIYSLGVILYELLCGELPFSPERLRKAGWAELQRVLADEDPSRPSAKVSTIGERASGRARARRTSVSTLSRRLRGDLDWIVLKALAKEPARRYDSATSLAMDLHRYLVHEPVAAGPPSAGYRMRKFARRYRGQLVAGALVFLSLVGGIVGTTAGFVRAEEKAAQLARRTDEFDMLSMAVRLDDVRERGKKLYPPWPEHAGAMRSWLRDDVVALRDGLSDVRATLAALRERSLLTADERRRRLGAQPRFAELARLRSELAARHLAHGARPARSRPAAAPAEAAFGELSAQDLRTLAWPLVDPKRRAFGREAEGLALARRGLAMASRRGRVVLGGTLAWALLANGRGDEAVAAAREVGRLATERDRIDAQSLLLRMQDETATARSRAGRARLQELEERVFELELELVDWRFRRPSEEFLYRTLARLEREIAAFDAVDVDAMSRRLAWAERVQELTIARFGDRWQAARAAIAAADGEAASELYARHRCALPPQVGLVPIGKNPRTGLWEFYHLRSAWDPYGATDPAALEIPVHGPGGEIEVGPGTGIVFVLVPGGTFGMGAQSTEPGSSNHDPDAESQEGPVHEVSLAPFFLARHEMTKGQWRRLSGGERPSFYRVGTHYRGDRESTGFAHPVEQVSWNRCTELVEAFGLVLPTEAQWEYAARAGTTTPWFTGDRTSALQGFVNLRDATAIEVLPRWGVGGAAELDDGFPGPAPVDALRHNPWGLHHVLGNVWEWCRDVYGEYDLPVGGPAGLRDVPTDVHSSRCYRGGAHSHGLHAARCSFRVQENPAYRAGNLGLRAARAVR